MTKKKTRKPSQREFARRHRQRQLEAQRRVQQPLNDRQVLSFAEWCALNNFSERTGRRILAGEFGDAPAVVRLSPRRIGISVQANEKWRAGRQRVAS